jgi:hypothetical protein
VIFWASNDPSIAHTEVYSSPNLKDIPELENFIPLSLLSSVPLISIYPSDEIVTVELSRDLFISAALSLISL